jgi:RNA-binding protein
MTGKQRAILRSQAHELKPFCWIGKEGLSENAVKSVGDAIDANELIKVKVLLESSPVTPKDAAVELSSKLSCDVIGVTGGIIILYKYNEKLHKDEKKGKKQ